jgi:hypothetical protein
MKMKSQTDLFEGWMLGRIIVLGFTSLHALIFAIPLSAQNCPVNIGVFTKCTQIGNAEAVSVSTPTGSYPALQPVVYWHDEEWKIDMLPQSTSDGELRMKIISHNSSTKIVNFPRIFAQVDSIARNPEDKAIIIAEANGTAEAFLIADLKEGKLIDRIGMDTPSISPDRRFILYINGYPAHGDFFATTQYRLYDTMKTPKENTCGYMASDPEHKSLIEDLRGFQVYPRVPGHSFCTSPLDTDNEGHLEASDFVWTADSSKAVFADVMNGNTISLILVKIPSGDKDREHGADHDRDEDIPRTLIYSFVGAENVCAGAANCDSNNVRSIAWNGDSVNVALVQANPTGPATVTNLTIPLSKFVPLGK